MSGPDRLEGTTKENSTTTVGVGSGGTESSGTGSATAGSASSGSSVPRRDQFPPGEEGNKAFIAALNSYIATGGGRGAGTGTGGRVHQQGHLK